MRMRAVPALLVGAVTLGLACSDDPDLATTSAEPAASATAGDTIQDAPTTAGETIQDAPATVGETIQDVPATAGETIQDAPATVGETIQDVPATAGETIQDGANPEPSDPDFGELDSIVDEFVEVRGLEGAGLVVVDADDGIVHEHYGGSFTADRVSFVASSSKMVSAGVLMRLHDDGLLDIDARLADAVEWGTANPDVTPAQLISNSSGLVGLLPDLAYAPYRCQWSPEDTLQDCAEQIFTTPDDDGDVISPDTEFRYGGGQWQVAGAVAEEVSGRSWDALIEEIYVGPCGLRMFGYANPFEDIGDVGFAYPAAALDDPESLAATQNPNIEAGLYTLPGDYAQLLLMHLRGGRCGDDQVLSAESVDRLHAERVPGAYNGGVGPAYGMGWWIDSNRGMINDNGAYGSFPWLDLDDGYGAYLVLEADNSSGLQLADRLSGPLDEIMGQGG